MSYTSNPFEAAIQWYKDVVDRDIKEVKRPGGVVQQVDVSVLKARVQQSPTQAQMIIQLLSRELDRGNDPSGNAKLHGTWIALAYLLAFGQFDKSSLMLKKLAPTLYDAAVEEFKKLR